MYSSMAFYSRMDSGYTLPLGNVAPWNRQNIQSHGKFCRCLQTTSWNTWCLRGISCCLVIAGFSIEVEHTAMLLEEEVSFQVLDLTEVFLTRR